MSEQKRCITCGKPILDDEVFIQYPETLAHEHRSCAGSARPWEATQPAPQNGGEPLKINVLSHLTEQERRDWDLAQKATPGPLIVSRSIPVGDEPSRVTIDALRSGGMGEVVADIKWHRNAEDLRFFAAARTGYPAALEQLSSARGERDSFKGMYEEQMRLKDEYKTFFREAESRLRDLREKADQLLKAAQCVRPKERPLILDDAIADCAALLEGQHG